MMYRALEWRMHPPTSLAFIRHFLTLLPSNAVHNGTWHDIMEMSRFLTELSVCDYYFVNHKPSVIAISAILNSIDGIDEIRLTPTDRSIFLQEVLSNSGLVHDSATVTGVRNMLRQMYTQSTGNDQQDELSDNESDSFRPVEDRFDADSPVFVGQIDSSRSSPFHEHHRQGHSVLVDEVSVRLDQDPLLQNLLQTSSARKTSKTASRTRPGGNN